MRRLAVAQLEAETPVVRRLTAEAGQDPVEAGKLDARRLGEGLGCEQCRRERLPPELEHVAEHADDRAGRIAVERRLEAEWLEHRRGEVVAERHLRAALEMLRECEVAGVRVDAPLARLPDRLRTIPREP